MNGQGPREDANSKSLDLNIVDDACSSNLFWAYAHMVKRLGSIIEHMMAWAESCPCHGHDLSLQGLRKHTVKGLHTRIGLHSCPLATRRAPECAAGHLLTMLRQLLNHASVEILFLPSTLACSEQDNNVVISDFNHARRHCILVGNLKFSLSLQLFAAAGVDAEHHWVSMLLCSPGRDGHQQLQTFAAGEAMSDLPLVERGVFRFQFAPISERWTESRHALKKRHLSNASHASPLHIAFLGGQTMLRNLLLQTPHAMNDLVRYCAECRNPLMALKVLGLHRHELVQELMLTESRRVLSQCYRPWFLELVYIFHYIISLLVCMNELK